MIKPTPIPTYEQKLNAYIKLTIALNQFKEVFKHDWNLLDFMDGEMKDAIELSVFCPEYDENGNIRE